MNSLDKITDKIIKQAEENANEILSLAEQKVKKIQDQSKKEQDVLLEEAEKLAEKEHKIIILQAESNDRQERRQEMLAVKRKVIRQIVSESKRQIENLPTKEYFDFLLRLFERNALQGEGKLYLSKSDSKRMPKDFIEHCNEKLSNGTVEFAGTNKNIEKGFLITYGKIEIDCSIDSVFRSKKQVLEDKAAKFLK